MASGTHDRPPAVSPHMFDLSHPPSFPKSGEIDQWYQAELGQMKVSWMTSIVEGAWRDAVDDTH